MPPGDKAPSYVLVANDASPVAGAPDIKSDAETTIQIANLKAQVEEQKKRTKDSIILISTYE